MKKEVISTKIDYSLNWAYSVEISQMRKDLDAIEKLGATHVEIDSAIIYDDSFEAVSEHLETDEEYKSRMLEREKKANEVKKAELEQFERIKSKYNL